MNTTQISYLTRADRTKELRKSILGKVVGFAAAAAGLAFTAGPATIPLVIGAAVMAAAAVAVPAGMLMADRRVAKMLPGHLGAIAEHAQRVADEKAAPVHAHVLQKLHDAGRQPRSLVIIVLNTANRLFTGVGSTRVLLSTIDADGALSTETADDPTSRWVIRNIASPFVTATDWRASIITATPGTPATAQLIDSAGWDVIDQECDKPYDEQFLSFHPARHETI